MSNPLRDHAARDKGHVEEHSGTGADWLNRLQPRSSARMTASSPLLGW